MKIAYRRMSGPIGTSPLETGTRGMWLEKRNALMAALRSRGHQLDVINRMTKFSQQGYAPDFDAKSHDLLFVEFGSSNRVFYKDDLAETLRMIGEHKGEVVFLCDDPDLPFLWSDVPDTKRWSAWYNATMPVPFGGQPESVRCYDFPFAALIAPRAKPALDFTDCLVYIGRPGGRKKAVLQVIESKVDWRVYAKPAEWAAFPVKIEESPTQAQRAEFYATKKGCICLADAKHKRMGWRTGRAYHAVNAGCPVIAEADHPALSFAASFSTVGELQAAALAWSSPVLRAAAWQGQVDALKADVAIAEHVFGEFEL